MTNRALQTRNTIRNAVIYTVLILWCAFSIFSLLWIIITSIKSNRELYAGVWTIPQKIHIENYVKAWNVVNLKSYFLNSILITFSSIIVLTFICTPAAYVLSRFKFRFSKALNTLFIAGMGIPYQLLLIPLYKIMVGIKLTDSLFGLGLVYVSLSIPFTTYLLSGFLRSLPSELEDSAMVDGCGEISTFWRIIFPLSQPSIITAAILNFIFLWNEYMLDLIFITRETKRTISLGLYSIQSAMMFTADWVGLFAAVVIVMLPTVLIYILLSEKVMKGITLGAVKG
ncbi:MAG: carbohydrate ABC transporter permease [Spirochaetales bacterium]|nr:MAG: carbohydrate ABC transporter permease [Spirochaetales bacterium]